MTQFHLKNLLMNDLISSPKRWLRARPSQVSEDHGSATAQREAFVKQPFRISWHDRWPIIGNVLFGVLGLLMMPSKPDVGLVTFTFFGTGGFFLAWLQWRKYQEHRLTLTSVEVAGGVRIRPSGFLLVMGLWMAVVGLVIYFFGGSYPALMRWLGAFIAVCGIVFSVLAVLRIFPAGFLQFEPAGLIIGHRGWQVLVPWDRIYVVQQNEMHSNPVITIGVIDRDALEITPSSMEAKARKILAGQSQWQWSPLIIFPMHYGIPAGVLAGAITRYVEDAGARRNLGSRQLPESSTP
jgi:hypothetical protein